MKYFLDYKNIIYSLKKKSLDSDAIEEPIGFIYYNKDLHNNKAYLLKRNKIISGDHSDISVKIVEETYPDLEEFCILTGDASEIFKLKDFIVWMDPASFEIKDLNSGEKINIWISESTSKLPLEDPNFLKNICNKVRLFLKDREKIDEFKRNNPIHFFKISENKFLVHLIWNDEEYFSWGNSDQILTFLFTKTPLKDYNIDERRGIFYAPFDNQLKLKLVLKSIEQDIYLNTYGIMVEKLKGREIIIHSEQRYLDWVPKSDKLYKF
ncbi:MAG: hypothetical protein ACTSRP_01885 [Candidatus Helarchaeota archaeon]